MEHRTGPAEPTGETAGDAAVWEQPLPWLRESGPEPATSEAGAAPETTLVPDPDLDPGAEPEADTEPAPEASEATPAPAEPAPVNTSADPEPANPSDGESESANAHAVDPVPVNTPTREPRTASSSAPESATGSGARAEDRPASGTATASAPGSTPSAPGTGSGPDSTSAPGSNSPSPLSDARPGRLSRLVTTRPITPARAPGGAEPDAAQPERSARLIGAVAAVSVLAALGLGTVAYMAVPGGDDSEPSAAHVEDAAVPTVGPDGSVLPSRSASPSARGHRTGDGQGKKPHVGKGGAKNGSSPSADGGGPAPEPAPAAHGGKAVEAASTHKAATKPAKTHPSDSKPAADSASKPAPGDLIVGYASSRCVSVSAHKGSDGSPLTLQGCGGDAWQKWVFASDGSVRSMGLCMDIATASTSDGAGIQLARCNGGWAQKFDLNGSHDLVNTKIGKCVDAKDSGTAAGTRLQLWDCGGTSNQKWHLG